MNNNISYHDKVIANATKAMARFSGYVAVFTAAIVLITVADHILYYMYEEDILIDHLRVFVLFDIGIVVFAFLSLLVVNWWINKEHSK